MVIKMISNKKGIEGLFGKEFVEKVNEAKKERQKEEKELELYEKQLDKKRKNLTNFLHKVYENEIVQELIKVSKYYFPVYNFGWDPFGPKIVFEKRGIYLENDGWNTLYEEFGKGYLEITSISGPPRMKSIGVEIVHPFDLGEKIYDPEKFKQTVLKNIKKQILKWNA